LLRLPGDWIDTEADNCSWDADVQNDKEIAQFILKVIWLDLHYEFEERLHFFHFSIDVQEGVVEGIQINYFPLVVLEDDMQMLATDVQRIKRYIVLSSSFRF
jgi:hypothetical protein